MSLDSIPLEPHFRDARQAGAVETTELDEGMFLLGLQAAAWRVPFLPTRVGLGSDVMRAEPGRCAPCVRPTPTARSSSPCPRSTLDVALVHMHRGDQGGNGQYLNIDPYFDDLFCMAATAAVHVGREDRRRPTDFAEEGPPQTLRINRLMTDGVVEAPHGAHFTECVPDYARDEAFQKRVRRDARRSTTRGTSSATATSTSTEAEYQSGGRRL